MEGKHDVFASDLMRAGSKAAKLLALTSWIEYNQSPLHGNGSCMFSSKTGMIFIFSLSHCYLGSKLTESPIILKLRLLL